MRISRRAPAGRLSQLLALTLATALVPAPAALAGHTGAGARIPPRAARRLLEIAQRTAVVEDVRHPHQIGAVLTTRGRVLRHLEKGTTAPSCEESSACMGQPVYVVAMRGRFRCNSCSPPPGRHVGLGSVITLEILPGSFARTGFYLGHTYPDLRRLGRVTRLRPGRR